MDKLVQFKKSGQLATGFIENIKPDQWQKTSNCDEWSVRDLVNHLTYEMLWIPPLVSEGKKVTDVGDKFDGDVLGDDPIGSFKKALEGAIQAFSAPGVMEKTVHLSYGDFPASYYCGHSIEELVVHGWDIAASTDQRDDLPDYLVTAVWEIIEPEIDEWRKGGAIAEAVKVPDDADPQTKLLAELGRDRKKYSSAA